MLSLLPVVLSSAFAMIEPRAANPATAPSSVPSPSYLLLDSPERHVRAAHPRIQAFLAEGLSRSRTFASLLAALGKTDVIVYIESAMALPKDTLGRLTMVPVPGKYRYLRVQIRPELSSQDAIALIAHEMRHALEIAEEIGVRDMRGLIKLYERIGHPTGGDHTYD